MFFPLEIYLFLRFLAALTMTDGPYRGLRHFQASPFAGVHSFFMYFAQGVRSRNGSRERRTHDCREHQLAAVGSLLHKVPWLEIVRNVSPPLVPAAKCVSHALLLGFSHDALLIDSRRRIVRQVDALPEFRRRCAGGCRKQDGELQDLSEGQPHAYQGEC